MSRLSVTFTSDRRSPVSRRSLPDVEDVHPPISRPHVTDLAGSLSPMSPAFLVTHVSGPYPSPRRWTAASHHHALEFLRDLRALGLPKQRQYESRSTFRNLALRADASEFHVNLITHPKPQKAADFYTRLEMQRVGTVRGHSRTVGVPSPGEKPKEKPRLPDEEGGARLVTPTGLEGAVFAGVSGVYAFPGIPAPIVTRPLDGPDASDPAGLPSPLPSFLEACTRLAIEAASRGDFARARELMEKAERVASLQSAPPPPTRG